MNTKRSVIDQHELDNALATAKDAASVARLVAQGANANAWIDDGSDTLFTPVGQALLAGRTRDLEVMLTSLAKNGQMPMLSCARGVETTLFDRLADRAAVRGCYPPENDALKILRAMNVPREWALELGQALLRATETSPIDVDSGRATEVARALALAAFDDKEQWFALLRRTKPAQALVEELFWQTDARDDFMAMVQHAIADGASVDEIPSAFSVTGDQVYTPSTLLQTAVIYQKTDLVKFFIEMGANAGAVFPNAKSLPEGLRGASTLSAAQTAGAELGQIIASALARQRVDQVLGRARQHSRAEAP